MRHWPGQQSYWGQMWPMGTYFSITGVHYLFSFLSCFSLQPFNHQLLLLSTCHLDDIALHLREWLLSNPQGSQWLSALCPSDRYFHLQGLTVVLLFEHRATDGAESTAQVKQTCTPKRTCTWADVFIIMAMPSVWPRKIIMHSKRAGGLNKNVVKISISKVKITVLWWQLWDWRVCWITLGKICLIGLSWYMQSSHFARPCLLHVIFLTHAIKDYLCKWITEWNPWPLLHLESQAPTTRLITPNK